MAVRTRQNAVFEPSSFSFVESDLKRGLSAREVNRKEMVWVGWKGLKMGGMGWKG